MTAAQRAAQCCTIHPNKEFSMLTLILALATGLAVGFGSFYGLGFSRIWASVTGMLALLAVQVVITLILRRVTLRINAQIQEIMLETQKKLQQKQAQFMRKPASQKVMMAQLEKEQTEGIRKALETCDLFNPVCKWNFFLKKQIATMRMMFLYQLKKYDEVDRLLPQCLFMDSQSISIKMARMYKTGAEASEIDRFFRKKARRLRNENAVLPYSLYAWILLKQGRNDDAFKVMTDAKAKTSDETVLRNWEFLANGRIKQFSNSGLAEAWYALALEEPKMPKVQQVYRRY